MMRTVQLAIADSVYANALRGALAHSGPWRVEIVERPDPALPCVLVLDELNFERLTLPLPHPQRVVLISRQDPQLLARAWDAGIVSVASLEAERPRGGTKREGTWRERTGCHRLRRFGQRGSRPECQWCV